MSNTKYIATIYAILAAALYAINIPLSKVSLLNNFEIVATSIIALIIFKEVISPNYGLQLFL